MGLCVLPKDQPWGPGTVRSKFCLLGEQQMHAEQTESIGCLYWAAWRARPPTCLHGKRLFSLQIQLKNLTLHELSLLYLTLLHGIFPHWDHFWALPATSTIPPFPHPLSFGLHISEFLELGLPYSPLLQHLAPGRSHGKCSVNIQWMN